MIFFPPILDVYKRIGTSPKLTLRGLLREGGGGGLLRKVDGFKIEEWGGEARTSLLSTPPLFSPLILFLGF